MSLKVYEEQHIQNAVNAIKEKTGKTDPMKVSQMADEIRGIVGSEPVVPLPSAEEVSV